MAPGRRAIDRAPTSIIYDLTPNFRVTRKVAFYTSDSRPNMPRSSSSADDSVELTEVLAMFSISLLDRVVSSIGARVERKDKPMLSDRDPKKQSDSFRRSLEVAANTELDTYTSGGDQEHDEP